MDGQEVGTAAQGVGAGRSVILIFFFSLLCISLPSLSPAQPRDLESALRLTEEQRLRIQDIEKRYREELDHVREEIIRKRIELERLRLSPVANEHRLRRLEEEIEELRLHRGRLFRAMRREIMGTLTKEQLKTFDEFCGGYRKRHWRDER